MNRFTAFVFGIVVGALGLYLTENFYIVRSDESFHWVPKVVSSIDFPYRDIRGYTTEDWSRDPALALAIVKSNKQELAVDSSLDAASSRLQELMRALGGNK